MTIKIIETVFEPFQEIHAFQMQLALNGKFGATSIFIGTMRDFNEGDQVHAMTLEHYEGMTQKQLEKIIEIAKDKWTILEALIVHRIGDILPSEPIVLIAIWSAHRADAFDACQYIMEELKSNAPFWKRETLNSNQTRWVVKNTDSSANQK